MVPGGQFFKRTKVVMVAKAFNQGCARDVRMFTGNGMDLAKESVPGIGCLVPERKALVDTPKRVAATYAELFSGLEYRSDHDRSTRLPAKVSDKLNPTATNPIVPPLRGVTIESSQDRPGRLSWPNCSPLSQQNHR